ncbi:uncharacterized protein N7496_008038 [Penicillium cataractarum]|uniref:Cupin type-2 domain-containing protein n=1 Tax=Penicillium cataractarum TaxID=2100454 RepID=A0A9W9S2B2_9EURO|nr:uncharacterized protein N7496_008038 [Penicillium cataractarum]KAJ5368278.1 hypothetical protein N7496_008038 [Penicillium cataractarum]
MSLNGELRPIQRYITSHDPITGKAIVIQAKPSSVDKRKDDAIRFNVPYTISSFPPDMNDDQDLKSHEHLMSSGKLGLVNPGGTVCRFVDFAPDTKQPLMHRTQSLDYGIVIEGCIDMILDSGEEYTLQRGDIAIQRGTMHAWRNSSKTDWARMVFVLHDSKELCVGGQVIGEDLGHGAVDVPPSRLS